MYNGWHITPVLGIFLILLGCTSGAEEPGCEVGKELCPCNPDEQCAPGLSCEAGTCVIPVTPRDVEPDPEANGSAAPVCDDGMCLIPAGSFWMGCNELIDFVCEPHEYPGHEVFLGAFHIDRTEVTQAAYQECVDADECDMPTCEWAPVESPEHPVECVDWHDAKAYCEWAGKRLPTEAEWEKAGRGTDGRIYPWGNVVPTCDLVVMDECPGRTQPVCSKSPAGDSPYGLCDMAGNVWEWVGDWYGADYYENSPDSNPAGPFSGDARVSRGGCFGNDLVQYLRVSRRFSYKPSAEGASLGFRCATSE